MGFKYRIILCVVDRFGAVNWFTLRFCLRVLNVWLVKRARDSPASVPLGRSRHDKNNWRACQDSGTLAARIDLSLYRMVTALRIKTSQTLLEKVQIA